MLDFGSLVKRHSNASAVFPVFASLNEAYCAAGRLLKERESSLRGTVLLLFQPAEEGLAGGKSVIDSGALKGVSAIHGLHVWPTLQTGNFASKVPLCRRSFLGLTKWILRVATQYILGSATFLLLMLFVLSLTRQL